MSFLEGTRRARPWTSMRNPSENMFLFLGGAFGRGIIGFLVGAKLGQPGTNQEEGSKKEPIYKQESLIKKPPKEGICRAPRKRVGVMPRDSQSLACRPILIVITFKPTACGSNPHKFDVTASKREERCLKPQQRGWVFS